ncbi:sugar ABC transporter substrate-binding protein [Amycolatopsis sp. DG1A-15b]|uniref:sugar ABC transporter substrate-binding protein n=1 Tax=Amycolatopsis sp. DG1A-15b TaxID=3052846 RepID=UPI00255B4809|nr:sugar ABC transporter substrate-binding protein [Amycolatopsis sp. DG1A-15b]WIX93238.1 sugar ABC transporter substrate-binding protein [Amycolatopsis sp. DG1A-15b]
MQSFTRRLAGVAALAALVLTACSGPEAEQPATAGVPGPSGGKLKVAVVTHGSLGDAFWNVVQNGAFQAGKDLDVSVTYYSDGDPLSQAKLIDNAVAQRVGGLVVSMANPQALQTSVQNAVKAGIPVVTINSGEDSSVAFGAIAHVGQSEGLAGQGAGQRLKNAGKTHLLCVIHEAGNIGQNQRCDGAKQSFGHATTLQVDINNPNDVQARIRGALQANPSIDAVLTLNSQIAARAYSAAKEASSKAQVATFDLNNEVVSGIKSGDILFAVDQQQYEQGYLPIVILKLYTQNGNTLGGGKPVQTGPGFVDKSNVDAITPYIQGGTR